MADTESLVKQLAEFAEKQDFGSAFGLVRENQVELVKKLRPAGVWEALKKTTNDRLLLSFLDGVEFGARPLDEALVRLEKLLSKWSISQLTTRPEVRSESSAAWAEK